VVDCENLDGPKLRDGDDEGETFGGVFDGGRRSLSDELSLDGLLLTTVVVGTARVDDLAGAAWAKNVISR
jgi:hypothetical protein